MTKKKKILVAILAALALLVAACGIYIRMIYNDADDTALAYYDNRVDGVTVTVTSDGASVFLPDDPVAGIIFYPGAGVEAEAYAPLMCDLAQQGICCVVEPMPMRIAFMGMNAADGVQEEFPQITEWYMAGHSLGGAVASMYLEKHADEYEGLVLLASYSTVDLSQTELSAITLYGENDGVLNFSNLEKDQVNLPADNTLVCIPGGNHARFGNYGTQRGDGEATITAEEQQEFTADTISEWMEANE